ncbi:aminotransferase DegT [Oleiphilus sp. HI0071]|nr:aminotransferase DegT [Oleiphilus sp. HI0065]KZY81099.1 aminotransferase DegT [Oleiphilus sp. HI0071]KZY93158.1 aminotransferase DegT [Oleiphilus sp. HI0073]KZZ13904.1 aminotransferase DegT [Oleiphilus sp. HI0079]KZZ18505.1 aminotransferase DegT [Oleiphilus sp. HI0080]KZZ47952.1 aminotransferase DegT [Oleiphilus sp. HI0122]KZZ77948.1 aminotransferase DegT [Oleiphilus sp. HI0133]
MKVDFANLQHQYQLYKAEIDARIQAVLDKSNYIMGEEVAELEQELEKFTGAKHAITCSNGTDALVLALMAMDIQPGDEVITTPFTFISTGESIAFLKATPVFVDIDPLTFNIDPNLIEAAITEKTKAIMPVSLYGQPADMNEINAIAKKHSLKVIIDGAQSFGSTYKGQSEVNHGDFYTTSFFPAKPLGCYGDGGAVFTNNDEYAEKLKMLRVHGQNKRYHHKYIGIGGRLDTIQAAVLLAKLPRYADEIAARQSVALMYNEQLSDSSAAGAFTLPQVKADRTSVYAQYTLRVKNRESLQAKLKEQGLPTAVHYPMPLHLQECFDYLDHDKGSFPLAEKASAEVMSLPMNAFLGVSEIDLIVDLV